MKLSIYFISAVLLVIFAQNIETKDLLHEKKTIEEIVQENPGLEISERDLRGIKDVWSKTREHAIASWNYFKNVAEKTKEKVTLFINKVKDFANELKHNFENKLKKLKEKLITIVIDLYGKGKIVKQCLRNEQENIEKSLRDIMAHMIKCMAGRLINLTQITSDEPQLAMNETKFQRDLDEKLKLCERNLGNEQECLYKVRESIFDNFTDMENLILKHHYESRNIADDIKGTLVTCSLSNLMEASNSIAAEILIIGKCVLEAKKEETTSLE